MPPHFHFHYRFHPAGQGVFASGTLRNNDSGRHFHWVYDCGSTAPKKVLKPAIERYRDMFEGERLDLLCISHFDQDHVNGLALLLKDLHVGTIVMPYYTFEERMYMLAKHSSPDEDYVRFLQRPQEFIITAASSVQRLIIVGGEGSSNAENRNDSRDELGGEAWYLTPKRSLAGATEPYIEDNVIELANANNIKLEQAPTSFGINVSYSNDQPRWEFLFFHKPIETTIARAVGDRVHKIIKTTAASTNRSFPEVVPQACVFIQGQLCNALDVF